MKTVIQFKRGNAAAIANYTGARKGEPVLDLENCQLYVCVDDQGTLVLLNAVADIITGENNNIKFMTGLNDKGIPASKIDGIPSANIQTLTDATNIVWDMNQGSFAIVTLAGNRILDNPINIAAGNIYKLKVIQDSIGERTLDFGSYFKFPGNVKPVLSSSAGTIIILEFTAYSNTELILTNFLFDI